MQMKDFYKAPFPWDGAHFCTLLSPVPSLSWGCTSAEERSRTTATTLTPPGGGAALVSPQARAAAPKLFPNKAPSLSRGSSRSSGPAALRPRGVVVTRVSGVRNDGAATGRCAPPLGTVTATARPAHARGEVVVAVATVRDCVPRREPRPLSLGTGLGSLSRARPRISSPPAPLSRGSHEGCCLAQLLP